MRASRAPILQLSRDSVWRAWAVSVTLARGPGAMAGLTLLYLGKDSYGSLAVGARLTGVYALAGMLGALWRGRAIDRGGDVRHGLRRDALVAGIMFVALAEFAAVDAPLWLSVVGAVAAGLTGSGVTAAFRTLLPHVAPAGQLQAAFSTDALLFEVNFITGPALAGLLLRLGGPVLALLAMAGANLSSALVAGRLPRPSTNPDGGRAVAPWRAGGMATLYGLAIAWGVSIGLLQAATPAKVEQFGGREVSAGVVLACYYLGSALGGMAPGLRTSTLGPPRRAAAILLVAFGLLLLPSAAAPGTLLLACALLFTGLPIARLNGLGATMVSRLVPTERRTEGFALYSAALAAGGGLGNLTAGLLLPSHSPAAILALAAAPPTAGGLLLATLLLRRRQSRREALGVARPSR